MADWYLHTREVQWVSAKCAGNSTRALLLGAVLAHSPRVRRSRGFCSLRHASCCC